MRHPAPQPILSGPTQDWEHGLTFLTEIGVADVILFSVEELGLAALTRVKQKREQAVQIK